MLLFSFSASAQEIEQALPTDSSNTVEIFESANEAKPEKEVKVGFQPDPQRAMLYSALVPGLGQIYNRKYWKLPIVYAGYAALIYAIWWNGGQYNDYRKAYISIADGDESTNFYMNYVPTGVDPATLDIGWMTSALNTKQLSYRRNRDLAIIGIVAFYGLTLLDSYVDAQLYDFDISPDLSLRVEPTLLEQYENVNTVVGLRCQFTF